MAEIVQIESIKCELLDEPTQRKTPKCLKFTFIISICLAVLMTTTTATLIYLLISPSMLNASLTDPNNRICMSPSCVIAASTILTSKSEQVDPCNDFYEYACGGLINMSNEDFIKEMNDVKRVQEILMNVFKTKKKINSETNVQKARNYYQSCMNETMIKLSMKTHIVRAISEVGGWPILNNIEHLNASTNVQDICTISNLLFEVTIIDLKNGPFIKISPPKNWLLSSTISKNAYKNLLNSSVYSLLSETNSKINSSSVKIDIDRILDLVTQVSNMRNESAKLTRLSFKSLDSFTNYNWRRFLNLNDITDMDIVYTSDLSYLVQVVKFYNSLASQNPRDFQNVHVWAYVKKILDMLSHGNEMDRAEYCTDLVVTNLPETFNQIYKEENNGVKEIINETIAVVIKQNMTLREDFFKLTNGNYNVNLVAGNFVKNSLEIKNMHYNNMMLLYRKGLVKKDFVSGELFKHMSSLNNSDLKQIRLSNELLNLLLYDNSLPNFLNYAVVGKTIAHEISHELQRTSEAFESIAKNKTCLVTQYNKYLIKETNEYLNGTSTLMENMADNLALELAFQAYKSRSRTQTDQKLVGLENFNSDQLFFIKYGQTFCAKISSERMPYSPYKFRVIGTLQNSIHFANAFKCKPNSNMNLVTKCSIKL